MDWKKIMNKRHGKADEKKAETVNKEKAKEEAVKEEIEQFFTKLLPEINLRLFLDMETMAVFFPLRLLWVEAVSVKTYQPPLLKEQSQKPGINRIWKRLMGTLTNIVPLRNK